MNSAECLRAIQKVLEETVCDPREEGADGLERIDVIVGAWDEKALPGVTATLRWALDLIDMYDVRLAEIDGAEIVYSATHVTGKRAARVVLRLLEDLE